MDGSATPIRPTGHQPVKVPARVERLLSVLPDVDQVKVFAIAREWQMDLDDPAFLPMLLCQRGIDALRQAQLTLATETQKTVDASINAVRNAAETASRDNRQLINEDGEEQRQEIIKAGGGVQEKAIGAIKAEADKIRQKMVEEALADFAGGLNKPVNEAIGKLNDVIVGDKGLAQRVVKAGERVDEIRGFSIWVYLGLPAAGALIAGLIFAALVNLGFLHIKVENTTNLDAQSTAQFILDGMKTKRGKP